MKKVKTKTKRTLTHQGSTQEQGESHTGRKCDITPGLSQQLTKLVKGSWKSRRKCSNPWWLPCTDIRVAMSPPSPPASWMSAHSSGSVWSEVSKLFSWSQQFFCIFFNLSLLFDGDFWKSLYILKYRKWKKNKQQKTKKTIYRHIAP